MYLTQCRRRQICPKFLTNCLQSARHVSGDNGKMKNINETYLQKCLNECIKTTYRRQAYLRREHNRLVHSSQNLPLFHWTLEKCFLLYQHERFVTNKKLSKKFAKLTGEILFQGDRQTASDGGQIQEEEQEEGQTITDQTQDGIEDWQDAKAEYDEGEDTEMWEDAVGEASTNGADCRQHVSSGSDYHLTTDKWHDAVEVAHVRGLDQSVTVAARGDTGATGSWQHGAEEQDNTTQKWQDAEED